MTDVTFQPPGSGFTFDWSDGAVWSDGTPPNSSNLDVVIPALDAPGTGTLAAYVLTIGTGESFKTGSIAVTNDYLDVAGTLSIANALTLASGDAQLDLNGGTITLGALSDDDDYVLGSGTIDSTGTIVNQGVIQGSGLTLNVAALHNDDTLFAYEGALTVNVAGASNLSNGVLTGGAYGAGGGGTLLLDLGSIVTTDNATILLGQEGGDGNAVDTVESVDPSSHDAVPLQSTLRTIASAGALELDGTQFASTGTIALAGSLYLYDNAVFSAASLDVASTGIVAGNGTLSGPITNNGIIVADLSPASSTLLVDGPVTGTGTLVVGPIITPATSGQPEAPTLELAAPTSENVSFSATSGTLVLDEPEDLTGTITPAVPVFGADGSPPGTPDDTLVIGGIAASNVTDLEYLNDSPNSGTLTFLANNRRYSFDFDGTFNTSSFALSSGPALSTNADSVPSLSIAITPEKLVPTIGILIDGTASPGPVITDDPNPTFTGTTSADTIVVLVANGTDDGTAMPIGAQGADSGTYTVSAPAAFGTGFYGVQAAASDNTGEVYSLNTVSLLNLPSPVDGIVTAPLASAQFAAALSAGYTTDFTPGTEAIQLTDGTLSVGPDTGAALVQRLYEGLLDRAADPGGLVGYTNILAQYGAGAVANDLLDSSEFATDHGALSTLSASSLVDLLYRGLLGRAPDAGGLASYLGDLAGGTSPGTIAAAIANSAESKAALAADTANVWVPNATGALITDLYQTAFDRIPDLSGLAAYTGALAGGLTPAAMADALAGSAEFKADHAGQDIAGLVTSFYSNGLGRFPDPSGLQFYTGQLESGASVGSVILAIATSQEAAGHLQKTV